MIHWSLNNFSHFVSSDFRSIFSLEHTQMESHSVVDCAILMFVSVYLWLVLARMQITLYDCTMKAAPQPGVCPSRQQLSKSLSQLHDISCSASPAFCLSCPSSRSMWSQSVSFIWFSSARILWNIKIQQVKWISALVKSSSVSLEESLQEKKVKCFVVWAIWHFLGWVFFVVVVFLDLYIKLMKGPAG